ncbi:hypothetical protein OsJ_05911 [Oryza sativa Japonica Group]|uniref:Uncharacterized protein n=1 Tax=Oryza sativa subsp. japonica TaxID=39947 RepID=A3A4L7_ORYSJ|nr:hypothetical protein OsJ_05911 [Oryza sativa Japonica Group]
MVLKKSTGRSSGHASTSYDASAGGGAVAVSAYEQRIRRNAAVLEKVAVSVHDSLASTREAALAELIARARGLPLRRRRGGREVRMAAGEALAVAIEMKLFTEKNNGALFSKMEARASDLANDAAGAGVDKTNFVEQKELFKDITTFLAGGKPPVISVRTSSSNYGLLTTSTWTDNVRLNFLRRFLAGGFLHHLQGKGLMGQVFVIDDDEVTGKLSAARSKRSLMKDTRIVKELNGGRGGGGGAMDEKKEKKQEMIKNSLEKKRTVKKERLIAHELKHGSSDL